MKYLTLCLAAIALLFTAGCSRIATEVNDLDGGDGETTESADAISVSPASATIPAEGDTFSTTVSSTDDWTMTGGEEVSWCEPSQESGSNGDAVTFTVAPNTTTSERNVTYTFRCGDESAKLTIIQSAPAGQDDSDPYTIYYTTYHLQPVLFNSTATFGANLVSHTYTDGTGKMIFDGPVTQIGGRAFENCIDLTSITIPESVIEIGDYAFSGCSKLKDITIPRSVTKIGDYAFFGCKGGNITISGGVIGNYAFAECGMTDITISDGVSEIGSWAFHLCKSLNSITIPGSVSRIGDHVFFGCSLTRVDISEGVAVIGKGAFSDCYSLASVKIPGSVTEIENSAFAFCSRLKSINIPKSVTEIGGSAFRNCTNLASITIPESVTSIAQSTFSGCSSLTDITIPEGVAVIGESAFYECSSLTSITIPESVTEIGAYAFEGCSGLTSITIPGSVTEIGYHAFAGCSGLTTVYCKATTPPECPHFDSSCTVYVPKGSESRYMNSDWRKYKIVGYDFN